MTFISNFIAFTITNQPLEAAEGSEHPHCLSQASIDGGS
jgi:hypothetical protein